MTEVIMPKMGDGMEEGTLLEWLKKDGDKVKSGEVIGTIQTDKATLELASPGSGRLGGLLIEAGMTVPVGRAIAAILKEGESLPADWGSGTTVAEPVAEAAGPEPEAVAAPEDDSRVKASPLARKIAREFGIALSTITGSGPGGRVVEKDVRAALEQRGEALVESAPTQAPVGAATPAAAPSGEDALVPLNRLRQITAQRTAQSKQQVPHFYVTVEVDLENIVDLRERFKKEEGGKVSVNDFVIRACALALRQMPGVNSSFDGTTLRQYGDVNIGMAVALEDGLTVPVLHQADRLTLRQIAEASRDLAAKARESKLGLDQLTGSTFSVSNMGMLNVDNFVAIINQPNAAILAVSSAQKVVAVNDDGDLEVRTRMNVTGSFDHRVVDGAVGARFMNLVRDYLQNPTRLLS
ncbi:MAG: 2-oxo acid dehydrogenase subunit E2 [Fimbriimonadaceae bacterium]|nr:2-oxo acid dehydrogenase subunit E2 [Fimbriimonadaceae bacterium]